MTTALWLNRDAEGFTAGFTVKSNLGTIRTGIPSGQFTVTVVNPADSASINPTVTESVTKPGLYTFPIPSSFFTTHGLGNYFVVIEVNALAPILRDVLSDILKIELNDLDTIPGNVWEETTAAHTTAGTFGVAANSVAVESTAAAGSTSTEIRTGLTQADDFFNDMQVVVVNAAGTVVRNITDYANTNGAITVDTLPFTPTPGDPVIILRRTSGGGASAAAVATAVWSEPLATGNFGVGEAGTRLFEVHVERGLDTSFAKVITDTSITIGPISQTITDAGATTTVQRT